MDSSDEESSEVVWGCGSGVRFVCREFGGSGSGGSDNGELGVKEGVLVNVLLNLPSFVNNEDAYVRSKSYPVAPFSLLRLELDAVESGLKPGNWRGVLVVEFDAFDSVDEQSGGKEESQMSSFPDDVASLYPATLTSYVSSNALLSSSSVSL